MNKCEWKDGKLWQCDNRPFMDCIPFKEWNFCPFCGADIRKPEETPLIVKSGETWAAHDKGIDYLWTGLESTKPPLFIVNCHIDKLWESFSEIGKEGLTDEIAKLRPMVIDVRVNEKAKLVYGDCYTCMTLNSRGQKALFRLATPHELQESE